MPEYHKEWTLNYIIEPAHIEADFTPPSSIDDLIEPPIAFTANFPMNYPTREDAVFVLSWWVAPAGCDHR